MKRHRVRENDRRIPDMALEKAKEFLKNAMTDESLRRKIASMQPDEIAAVAEEAGFEVTADELEKAEHDLRRGLEDGEKPVELDKDELDKIAGGEYWEGDDAPDGHEMGCYIFYHRIDYAKETGIECTNHYYGKLDGCSKIDKTVYWTIYCKNEQT